VDNRDELVEFLKQNGISTMVHYNKAVHMQEAYKLESCLPITEKIVDNILSLPLYPELKEKEIKYIAEIIKKFTL